MSLSEESNGRKEDEYLYESDNLPNDAVYYIFEFCTVRDIVTVSSVSKKWSWSVVAKSSQVWEKRYTEAMTISPIRKYHRFHNFQREQVEKVEKQRSYFKKYAMLRRVEKELKNIHYITYIPSTVEKKRKNSRYRRTIKLVTIGDTGVGKTCLLVSYTSHGFPDSYIPTVFDNYSATILRKEEYFSLGLWDTAGSIEFAELRPLGYKHCNVFLVCFSVTDRSSFENIRSMWIEELKIHRPEAAIVVCATKIDLRGKEHFSSSKESNKNEDTELEIEPTIGYEEGYLFAESIGAAGYFETSDYTAKDMSLYCNGDRKGGRGVCEVM